ncbi:DUF3516 domain-containing protein [Nocardioides ungokensis]|uniref:DUF3516 domain-containing protein n=1 Tax=Nocardioides ungokensis TaxID=1643322 RepID=UPI0024842961|nr:DUF3516 domain-containing protein [Nocardioides ungokensis]
MSWVPAVGASADAVYDALLDRVAGQGLELYPHQDEAVFELLAGNNVILATPTGSGKSLVALAAHAAALATDRVSFYTAPIKALVSEKFFALCEELGPDNVGMLTGDASVNAEAPVICCTAEVLANIALREGSHADVGLVVMDEFHFYAEPDRGWAWQVPLLELPQAQFLLMSATLGDVSALAKDLTRRNGRETSVVDDAARPVPLTFSYAMTPLPETLEELVATKQGRCTSCTSPRRQPSSTPRPCCRRGSGGPKLTREQRDVVAERIGGFRFGAGFGKTSPACCAAASACTTPGCCRATGVSSSSWPRPGCSRSSAAPTRSGRHQRADPDRLFTGLAKFDGSRQRILRTREFLQIAGRAGRAGFDTAGTSSYRPPSTPSRTSGPRRRPRRRTPHEPGEAGEEEEQGAAEEGPEGAVVWTEQTYDKLVAGEPEPLVSRMKVDNAMLLNVVAREEDAFPVLRRLLTDNHEDRRAQLRLSRRALRLARSLLASGVLTRLEEPDQHGRLRP